MPNDSQLKADRFWAEHHVNDGYWLQAKLLEVTDELLELRKLVREWKAAEGRLASCFKFKPREQAEADLAAYNRTEDTLRKAVTGDD